MRGVARCCKLSGTRRRQIEMTDTRATDTGVPDIAALYLDEAFRSMRGNKRLADGAMAQLSDDQFFAIPSAESNSVAIIVKHMAGNMRSRFTDFLTTDGEKPDRNRDHEFIIHTDT